MRSILVRAGVVLAVAATVVLGLGAPASAHVTIDPGTATQGGFATLTFRVPNEKATASTVRLEVQFPQEAPITSVSVKPVVGWTADVQRRTLDAPITGGHGEQITEVVGMVSWTASPGAEITPGQFQEFDISAGPLPSVDRVVFKVLQTYSDGDIVRWIDEPNPAIDLEHPAPVLTLVPAAQDSAEGTSDDAGGGGLALGFGIAGFVLGLVGAAFGLLAWRRR